MEVKNRAQELAVIEQMNQPRPENLIKLSRKPTPSLLDYDLPQLTELVVKLGFPAFRAKQIWGWLYKQYANDYAQMNNLPKALLEKLAEVAPLAPLQVVVEKVAYDAQTRKALFRLPDGAEIEAVLMLYEDRATVWLVLFAPPGNWAYSAICSRAKSSSKCYTLSVFCSRRPTRY
jgi:hypothetical protein